MKIFLMVFFIGFCLKAINAHAAPGCLEIMGAYEAAVPGLQGFTEGNAARAACERGAPPRVLLQQLEQRKASLSYRISPIIAPTQVPSAGVVCQNYGYRSGVVCSTY